MSDERKFRRRFKKPAPPDEIAPVPPLETRAERQTRREAEHAQRRAEDEARERAEAEAEAERRRLEAEAEARHNAQQQSQRAAEAQTEAERRAREEAERKEQAARAEARAAAEADRHRAAQQEALRRDRQATQATAEEARRAEEHRQAEQTQPIKSRTPPRAMAAPQDWWDSLSTLQLDEEHLARNKIITAERHDPAHAAFDVLRTRLLQSLHDHGWKRVAITSPGKDCGKTFTAANLAISLSRQENCRTLLMDCDMRRPSLHTVLGVDTPGSMGDMLRGSVDPGDHLLRMGSNRIHAGRNIAFGLNDVSEPYASELLQDPSTAATLDMIEERYSPDVMLFDLPPALFYDDVIAFRPHFDGVLLVIGGGLTTEKEVKEVQQRLGDQTPLLGMVLNKAEGTEINRYRY